jgi:predicted permease
MNAFVVWVALPPLFFNLLSVTPVEEFGNGTFFVTTTAATFLIMAVCFCVARVFRKSDTQASTIQALASGYGNIGYLGPPLAVAAFGPAAGVPVALIFCFENAMHFTLAPLMMAAGDNQRKNPLRLVAGIVTRIVFHPFILATLVGVAAAFTGFRPAAPVQQVLDSLANAAAPCALFVMGVTAALRPLKRVPIELTWLIPFKLIVHPLLVWFAVTTFTDVDDVWLYSAVLLAALPTATNVFVLAQQYTVWEERASSAVVLSTLLSIPTITLVLYLLTNSGT